MRQKHAWFGTDRCGKCLQVKGEAKPGRCSGFVLNQSGRDQSSIARRREAAMTPEQRSARSRRGHETRRKKELFTPAQEHNEARNLLRRLAILEDALDSCGTNQDNPDTCGVCKLHFAECESEENCVGDDAEVPTGREPSCPGARARRLLAGLPRLTKEPRR